MSGIDIPRLGRNVTPMSFQREKTRWLDEKLGISQNIGPPNTEKFIGTTVGNPLGTAESEDEKILSGIKSVLPLKYLSLVPTFLNAPDEDLLKLREALDTALISRGRRVQIVLQCYRDRNYRNWENIVKEEVDYMAASDYVKANHLDLDIESQDILTELGAIYLHGAIGDDNRGKDELDNDLQYTKLLVADLTEKLGHQLIDSFYDGIQESVWLGEFAVYYSNDPENPYLVSALEILKIKGLNVANMLLYNLTLPLGSTYIIGFNGKYGEYPIITSK